jgi:regulatory protein
MARRRRPQREPDEQGRDLGPQADPESVARTIVLTKLTGQARSRAELEKALADRGVPSDVAAAVLDRFQSAGLVDDTAFASAWVQSRGPGRGLSRRALRHELRGKGVNDDDIAEALEELNPETEAATARRLVERKLQSVAALPADVRFRRLLGVLARRGYPAGLSVHVIREALAEHDRQSGADYEADRLLDPL